MPKKLEDAFKRSAIQHGYRPGTKQYDRYVYGSMNKLRGSFAKGEERSEAARKLAGKDT